MNGKSARHSWHLTVLLVVTVLVIAEPAAAQTGGDQPPVTLYDVLEPRSGARITVRRPAAGEVQFEVAHSDARISRHATRHGSLTVIQAGPERLALRISRDDVTLEGAGTRLEVRRNDDRGAQELRARIAASEAVSAAIAMLREVPVGPATPMGGVLASTRFLLRSLRGDQSAGEDLTLARGALAARLGVRPVSHASEGCWEDYAQQAVRIVNDWLECRRYAWVSLVGHYCDLDYDIAAVAALAEYLACVVLA